MCVCITPAHQRILAPDHTINVRPENAIIRQKQISTDINRKSIPFHCCKHHQRIKIQNNTFAAEKWEKRQYTYDTLSVVYIFVSHTFRLSIWSLNLVSINENLWNDFVFTGMCLCAVLWASQCGHDTNIQHTTHAIIFNWFILFDSLVNLYSPLYLNFFLQNHFATPNCRIILLPSFRRTHITRTHAHAHSWDFLKCVCCAMASISILAVISWMGYCVV